MRRLPLLSAIAFGSGAVVFAIVAGWLISASSPDASAQPLWYELALGAAYAVPFVAPPAFLWGYVAGRHLERVATVNASYFALIGAFVAIASALSLVVGVVVWESVSSVDPVRHFVTSLPRIGLVGFVGGIAAFPFGSAVGIVLWSITNWNAQPSA